MQEDAGDLPVITEDITVVIPTSPIPSHPSTQIIGQCICELERILPESPIIVMADGSEDESYFNYLNNLCERFVYNPDFWVQEHSEHVHQSGMLKEALDGVKTPFVLYLEHDWILLNEIPWREFMDILSVGYINTIKLHAAPRIHPYYEHLMLDRILYQQGGFYDRYQDSIGGEAYGFIKTIQWSQNPHLCRTDFYREKILPYCLGKCGFIEEIIHGIVASSSWEQWKTAIYNPVNGDMMRIRHLDGRNSVI